MGSAFLLASAVPSAQAQGPSPAASAPAAPEHSAYANLINTGRELFEDQRYEESIQTLSAVLLRPGVTKRDRIAVYQLLAYNYITLGRRDEAEAAVRGLYVIEPDFALTSSESPRFREFFNEVKAKWEAEGRPGITADAPPPPPKPVSIRHASPAERERMREIRLSGDIQDPDKRGVAVVVHYRTGTRGPFLQSSATVAEGHFSAIIPAFSVRPPVVEYYIEVLDDTGLPIATRGDAAAPLRIAVPVPPPPPPEERSASIFASPWFWGGTGAIVVGGVLTALLLSGRSSEPSHGPAGPPTSQVIVVVGQ
jgi:hypothetical protein